MIIVNIHLNNVVREKLKRAKDSDKSLDRENRKRAEEIIMKNNKFNLQLFADEPSGATTPQDNGTTPPTQSIDYESEYKKMVAERDALKTEMEKQKGLKDKYATENAEYKKKELEKMSDEEKKAKELQDLIDSKTKIEAELQEMKLEKEIYAKGFTDDECAKLKKSGVSVSAISCFADILKARIEENTKNVKATLIKDTTPVEKLGKGTTENLLSDFAKFQKEEQAKMQPKEVKF